MMQLSKLYNHIIGQINRGSDGSSGSLGNGGKKPRPPDQLLQGVPGKKWIFLGRVSENATTRIVDDYIKQKANIVELNTLLIHKLPSKVESKSFKALLLQEFYFTVQHCAGKDNEFADFLSRTEDDDHTARQEYDELLLPPTVNLITLGKGIYEVIVQEQKEDPTIERDIQLMKNIERKRSEHLTKKERILKS
ncbi:unnamed protein product [Ceutorhynchus assimilis]|uniref:Uncharacterized protein n=1 Tax=Ceutorhynchus assimilis TaxID=467358 RepID=A0A9N9MVN4_9CUCU|nr:unnamed protein product [Ceutorhynchus assimilis]